MPPGNVMAQWQASLLQLPAGAGEPRESRLGHMVCSGLAMKHIFKPDVETAKARSGSMAPRSYHPSFSSGVVLLFPEDTARTGSAGIAVANKNCQRMPN